MRFFRWIGALRRDERGNALLIGAAVMPLLLGAAGLAIDTIQFSVWKRELQRAADSGAVAGVYALTQEEAPSEAVHTDLDQNTFPVLTQTEQVQVGPRAGFQQTVWVRLEAQRRLPFMSIFVDSPFQLRAEATAALIEDGTFCVLSLYNGTSPGIDVNGTADVNLGCGMASNSRADQAVTAGGDSTVTASPIMAVGNLNGAANNFATGTVLQPHAPEQADPFLYLPTPPALTGCTAVNVGPNDPPASLSPDQCYSSFSIAGTATLAPGVYFINGDVSFGAQANVTGTGVTFVMTGPGGQAGDLDMNGQATLNLSAPRSGDYSDVLFYRDRRSDDAEIRINGGSLSAIQGALYFPTSNIRINGNAGFQLRCMQLVGQILSFSGNAEILNSCPAGGPRPGFRVRRVRLVE